MAEWAPALVGSGHHQEVAPLLKAPQAEPVTLQELPPDRPDPVVATPLTREPGASVHRGQAVKVAVLAVAGLWVAYQVFLAASGRARGVP